MEELQGKWQMEMDLSSMLWDILVSPPLAAKKLQVDIQKVLEYFNNYLERKKWIF